MRIILSWYARGDLNPYPFGMEPKSIASASSATGANFITSIMTHPLGFVKENAEIATPVS